MSFQFSKSKYLMLNIEFKLQSTDPKYDLLVKSKTPNIETDPRIEKKKCPPGFANSELLWTNFCVGIMCQMYSGLYSLCKFPTSYFAFLGRSSALIYDAIKEIETKSCLAFTKHRSSDRNWIKFELGDGYVEKKAAFSA